MYQWLHLFNQWLIFFFMKNDLVNNYQYFENLVLLFNDIPIFSIFHEFLHGMTSLDSEVHIH
jgi:hypothetical protein